jgi:hypothetical protein
VPELAAGVAAGALRLPAEPLPDVPEPAAFDAAELPDAEPAGDLADCVPRVVPSDADPAVVPAEPGRL